MPNRNLNAAELMKARELIDSINRQLQDLAGNDLELLFAYRRKVYKELIYGERGRPMDRVKLKINKVKEQDGKCAACRQPLAKTHNVLDRLVAKDGYTPENTRVLCQSCDVSIQVSRRYA